MVLGPEAEGDGVTLGCLDAVWLEDEIAGLGTNSDLVVNRKSGARNSGSSKDGGEMHDGL